MTEKAKNILYLFARLIPGAVLLYAGYIKLMSPAEEFAYAIESYKIIYGRAALYAAMFFPWLEVYCGILLISGLFVKKLSAFSAAVFIFFELLLAQAFLRGLEIKDCGCFGAAHSNSLPVEMALNIVWLSLLFLSFKKGSFFSLDSFWENKFKNEK